MDTTTDLTGTGPIVPVVMVAQATMAAMEVTDMLAQER